MLAFVLNISHRILNVASAYFSGVELVSLQREVLCKLGRFWEAREAECQYQTWIVERDILARRVHSEIVGLGIHEMGNRP